MKINRLDAHDRLQFFKKEDFDIGKTCQNIIDQCPFGNHPFYIFAHKREIGLDERLAIFNDDYYKGLKTFKGLEDVPTHRIIWQPRLTKPKPQENSMLFKGYPGSDNLKIIWIIPQRELWPSFEKGKMTEDPLIWKSIHDFQFNPEILEEPEDDDLTDQQIKGVYLELARGERMKKAISPLIIT
jgi:hypothetical protein